MPLLSAITCSPWGQAPRVGEVGPSPQGLGDARRGQGLNEPALKHAQVLTALQAVLLLRAWRQPALPQQLGQRRAHGTQALLPPLLSPLLQSSLLAFLARQRQGTALILNRHARADVGVPLFLRETRCACRLQCIHIGPLG